MATGSAIWGLCKSAMVLEVPYRLTSNGRGLVIRLFLTKRHISSGAVKKRVENAVLNIRPLNQQTENLK